MTFTAAAVSQPSLVVVWRCHARSSDHYHACSRRHHDAARQRSERRASAAKLARPSPGSVGESRSRNDACSGRSDFQTRYRRSLRLLVLPAQSSVLEYCLRILLEEPIPPELLVELRATIERELQELERQAPEVYDFDELTVDDYLNEALPPSREGQIAMGALTWAVGPAAEILQIPQRSERPPGQIDRWWER